MFGLAPCAPEEGAKAPRRAKRVPQTSAGARRRGVECPELLFLYISTEYRQELTNKQAAEVNTMVS